MLQARSRSSARSRAVIVASPTPAIVRSTCTCTPRTSPTTAGCGGVTRPTPTLPHSGSTSRSTARRPWRWPTTATTPRGWVRRRHSLLRGWLVTAASPTDRCPPPPPPRQRPPSPTTRVRPPQTIKQQVWSTSRRRLCPLISAAVDTGCHLQVVASTAAASPAWSPGIRSICVTPTSLPHPQLSAATYILLRRWITASTPPITAFPAAMPRPLIPIPARRPTAVLSSRGRRPVWHPSTPSLTTSSLSCPMLFTPTKWWTWALRGPVLPTGLILVVLPPISYPSPGGGIYPSPRPILFPKFCDNFCNISYLNERPYIQCDNT